MDEIALVGRLLDAVELEIAPKTAEGVARGNKLFGAAILRKAGRTRLRERVEKLTEIHAGLSEIYQGKKHLASGDIPLD